jgi:hypothetical protein
MRFWGEEEWARLSASVECSYGADRVLCADVILKEVAIEVIEHFCMLQTYSGSICA